MCIASKIPLISVSRLMVVSREAKKEQSELLKTKHVTSERFRNMTS